MAIATHDIIEVKRRMQGASAVLKTEMSGLRTGRASAHLLDPVMVEAYGSQMPLAQVGTVSVPEPRMISVNVWDRSLVHAVDAGDIGAMKTGMRVTPRWREERKGKRCWIPWRTASQRLCRGQSLHAGAAGVQTRAPSSIRAWLKSPPRLAGSSNVASCHKRFWVVLS